MDNKCLLLQYNYLRDLKYNPDLTKKLLRIDIDSVINQLQKLRDKYNDFIIHATDQCVILTPEKNGVGMSIFLIFLRSLKYYSVFRLEYFLPQFPLEIQIAISSGFTFEDNDVNFKGIDPYQSTCLDFQTLNDKFNHDKEFTYSAKVNGFTRSLFERISRYQDSEYNSIEYRSGLERSGLVYLQKNDTVFNRDSKFYHEIVRVTEHTFTLDGVVNVFYQNSGLEYTDCFCVSVESFPCCTDCTINVVLEEMTYSTVNMLHLDGDFSGKSLTINYIVIGLRSKQILDSASSYGMVFIDQKSSEFVTKYGDKMKFNIYATAHIPVKFYSKVFSAHAYNFLSPLVTPISSGNNIVIKEVCIPTERLNDIDPFEVFKIHNPDTKFIWESYAMKEK